MESLEHGNLDGVYSIRYYQGLPEGSHQHMNNETVDIH